jgi:hypothetical protein
VFCVLCFVFAISFICRCHFLEIDDVLVLCKRPNAFAVIETALRIS